MPTYRDEPERPRQEPEIIPPDKNSSRGSAWPPSHGYAEARGSRRIYVARIGPLGFAREQVNAVPPGAPGDR